jgi:hypothetical protein
LQAWKVEAIRDGRLAGEEIVAFDRHAAWCATCRAATRRLERLAAALAELPIPRRDPLAVRRDRQRLLEAADAEATGLRPRSTGSSRAVLVVAAAAAVALAAGGVLRHRVTSRLAEVVPLATTVAPSTTAVAPSDTPGTLAPSAPPSAPASAAVAAREAPPSIVVSPAEGARWSERNSAREERIRLDDGTLSLDVKHDRAPKRLVLQVPDGEIEDLGTVFSVTVEKARTRRVIVRDGRVAVRLRGRPVVIVAAGETWESDPPRARQRKPPSATAEALPNRSCAGAASWEQAMSAFEAGRYDEAAEAFGAFSNACGGDRRTEDAAYLEIVALARAGRKAEARAAAERYLAGFPQGFRRKESEAFLGTQVEPSP